MSNQGPNRDQENRSNPNASFKLNPSATEFVPKFGGVKPNPPPQQQQQQQQHHHQQQPHNLPPNSYYKNHNNNFMMNQNDIDPIEMEARCEAVVEILQDERIREHLNPVTNGTNPPPPPPPASQHKSPPNHHQPGHYQHNQHYHQQQQQQDFNDCDDEEEMFEMMAMQEECRMEMMKFYIQSQNPELFSEIYHDVSYPEQSAKLNPQGAPPVQSQTSTDATPQPPATATSPSASYSSEATESLSKSSMSPLSPATGQQQQQQQATVNPLDDPSLNPQANEFLPNKLGELDLNQDTTTTTKTNN
jgi:hypothetical protein